MLKNRYWYEDDYMYFTFDDTHSSKYNLFIVNDNNIQLETDYGASPQFEAPQYQEVSYYVGLTKEQKSFNWSVAAYGLTQDEYKEMFKWLKIGKTGFLMKDSNIDWGWDTVISNVVDTIITPIDCQHFIVEFNIEILTIGTELARNSYVSSMQLNNNNLIRTYTYSIITNKYGIPDICYYNPNQKTKELYEKVGIDQEIKEPNSFELYLPCLSNEFSYFDYNFTLDRENESNFYIKVNNANDYNIKYDFNSSDKNIQFYGLSNYIIANDTFAEQVPDLITNNFLQQDIIRMKNSTPQEIKNYTIQGNKMYIDKDSYYKLIEMKNWFLCASAEITEQECNRIAKDENNNNYQNWAEWLLSNNVYPTLFLSKIVFSENIAWDIDQKEKYCINIPQWINIDPKYNIKLFFGEYNKLSITNQNVQNRLLTVYRYNNL